MLLWQVLHISVATVAAALILTNFVGASVPFSEIKIRIIDDNRFGKFESEVRKSFETTKNFFARNEILASLLSKGASFIPRGDTVSMAVDGLMAVLRDESDWREIFAPKIAEQIEISTIENDFRHMDAEMTVISENIRYVKHNYRNDLDTQRRKLDEIHDRLNIMITKFGQELGLYQKYPMEVVPTLFTLAKLFASGYYVTLDSISDAPQAEKSLDLACKLHDVLIDYRIETVRKRLNAIDIFDEKHEICNAEKMPKLFNVMQRFYNRNGYHRRHAASIDCVKIREIPKNSTYLKDNLGENGIFFHHKNPEKNSDCIYGYMEFIRYQVEQFFNDPIDLVGSICTKRTASQRSQQTTGKGWLTLTIKEVYWMPIPSGKWWDFSNNHKGQLYLKIFIDDDYDPVQTSMKTVKLISTVKHPAIFYETFKSKKIANNTNVKVEIWNKSDSFDCSDDLLAIWSTNVKNLLFNGRHQKDNGSFIDTSAKWKNEMKSHSMTEF